MYCTIAGPSVSSVPSSSAQRRHGALGVDRVVVGAVLELVRLQVDLDEVGGDAGFGEATICGDIEQAPGE